MVTAQNLMQELQNPKNWKKTHKKSYEVYMCRPVQGTKCHNELENVDYVTDDKKQFIISGTQGEVWAVAIDSIAKSYTFMDGTPITPDTLKRKCDSKGQIDWTKIKTKSEAALCWAFFLPKSIQNFPVRYYTANMSGVNHGYGDFLLCDDNGCGQPNLDRMRVINGIVFPKTYDLHGFPGMFSTEIVQGVTPRPKYNFINQSAPKNKIDTILNTIASGLRDKGHRVGKLLKDSNEQASLSLDNGKFGIVLNLTDEESTMISIMTNVTGAWEEAACWFMEDHSMADNISKIHTITTGKNNKASIQSRANSELHNGNSNFVFGEETVSSSELIAKNSADKMLRLVNSVAPQFGFTSVNMEGGDGNYRVTIDKAGAPGFACIDFNEDKGGSKGYACFLYDFCDETAGTYLNINDKESVKKAINLIHREFSKYM